MRPAQGRSRSGGSSAPGLGQVSQLSLYLGCAVSTLRNQGFFRATKIAELFAEGTVSRDRDVVEES
jgi:hypothetical protein